MGLPLRDSTSTEFCPVNTISANQEVSSTRKRPRTAPVLTEGLHKARPVISAELKDSIHDSSAQWTKGIRKKLACGSSPHRSQSSGDLSVYVDFRTGNSCRNDHKVLSSNPVSKKDCLYSFQGLTRDPSLINMALTKDEVSKLHVLGQVDQKFIVSYVNRPLSRVMVVIDQHAADERIRLEELVRDFHASPTLALSPSVLWIVEAQDAQKFDMAKMWLEKTWKIKCSVHEGAIELLSVPEVILTWFESITSARFQNWLLQIAAEMSLPWGQFQSMACRSAIMFGDLLDRETCGRLIDTLGTTKCPFICAHGRPAFAPLMTFPTKRQYFRSRITWQYVHHVQH
jgi:DNA mismatch repair ATPase MutL